MFKINERLKLRKDITVGKTIIKKGKIITILNSEDDYYFIELDGKPIEGKILEQTLDRAVAIFLPKSEN